MAGFLKPIIYDLRGLKCPMPILKTARRLKDLASGDRLTILSDDPLAEQDFKDLCCKYHLKFDYHHRTDHIAFTIIVS
ncbi:sulfurtransferase TusA family protein [Bartonella sp. HY038]|uniref:sulfurtransferase TusA family protein n=1 Tax=Bartonella sp. HY038 TaxID=2759660 RepID=UPI0015FD446C|nr:sulfurtransferase TusA family protein [Bartonella sp. HY038]